MTDVARKLGVSQATVAAALNGTGGNTRVNPLRAAMIRQAAYDMGYVTNSAARAVVTGRFNAVSLLHGVERNMSLLPEGVLDGIYDGLSRRGAHLVVSRIPDEKLEDASYVPGLLRELVCDGFIVNYQARIPERFEELIRIHKLPAFWVNSMHDSNCVYPDEYNASFELTQRLLSLGHRSVMFAMMNSFTHFSTYGHYRGYAGAMTAAGLKTWLKVYDKMTEKNVMESLCFEMRSGDFPTAVVCYAPDAAKTVLRAAMYAGIRVPEELSVATFSDVCLNDIDHVVTGVLLPVYEMGASAVNGLYELIENPELELPPRVLRCGFCAGDTAGAPGRCRRAARRKEKNGGAAGAP